MYTQKKAYKGQIVIWYENGVKDEDNGRPAVVLRAMSNTVALRVFDEFRDKDYQCVRHISDPSAKEYDRIDSGGWDYTEEDQIKFFHKNSAVAKDEQLVGNFAEVE